LPGEDAHVSDRLADPIGCLLFREEAAEPFRRDLGHDVPGIDSLPRLGQGTDLAEVGGEYLDRGPDGLRVQEFHQGDRQGAGFLARRAARYPEADRRVLALGPQDLGKDALLEDLEDLRFSEETGHVDEDVLIK